MVYLIYAKNRLKMDPSWAGLNMFGFTGCDDLHWPRGDEATRLLTANRSENFQGNDVEARLDDIDSSKF